MFITPYHTVNDLPPMDKWGIDEKITVFQARMYGWHLHIAEQLVNPSQTVKGEAIDRRIPDADFAALQIVMSYPETIAKYWYGHAGHGESKEYFRRGMRLLFPFLEENEETNKILNEFYSNSRCGLYHSTSTKVGILGDPNVVIAVQPLEDGTNYIAINTHTLIPGLINHLNRYCAMLRDPANTERRDNFVARFAVDHM